MPDVGSNGYGELEVQNGTSEDAVLSLYDSAADETVRDVYVQARHSVRMKEIPRGTYQLAYTAGLDWDDGDAIFRCDPEYAQFERDFGFTEERNEEGVQYQTITVTLHPVIGGNIRTKRISREEFLKSHFSRVMEFSPDPKPLPLDSRRNSFWPRLPWRTDGDSPVTVHNDADSAPL
jgi:hypothetical protein